MDQMGKEKEKSQKDQRRTLKSETILTSNKSRNPRELFKNHQKKMMLTKMDLSLSEKNLESKQIIEIENTVSKIIEENTVVVIETIKIEETIEEDTTTMIIIIGKIEFIRKMIKTIIIIKVIEAIIEEIVIEIIMTVMITKIPEETEIIIEEIIKIDVTMTEMQRETILRRNRNDFLYEVIFKKK